MPELFVGCSGFSWGGRFYSDKYADTQMIPVIAGDMNMRTDGCQGSGVGTTGGGYHDRST